MSVSSGRKSQDKTVEVDKTLTFIEDLCWLLDANKAINFKKVPPMLRTLRESSSLSGNDNKPDVIISNLIGVLPALLKDEGVFTTNSSLVQFAKEVLSLNISRWEKRSRFEIIGLIICNVEEVNADKLEALIQVSLELLKNKDKVKKEIQNNDNLFSWNETIQKIVTNDNE
ncbi:hypothetical protein CE91St41_04630 [Oscillospiraceae bacterium]|nr:hypothetical protein CE91St40_04650 [Oscillospiraceae bacterium]BDF73574.1 hypothetical protein CE91St41_04630 [Oscillospiraceae bacterium]